MPRIKKYTIMIFILFKLFLDFIFKYYIAEQRLYYGYVLNYSLGKTIIMWTALFLYIPFGLRWLYSEQYKGKVLFFLSALYYIPGLSTYQYIEIDKGMLFGWMIFWWSLFVFSKLPSFTFDKLYIVTHTKILFYFIILSVSAVVIYYSWQYVGFRILITFTNEYVLRSEESQINMPLIIDYIYSSVPVMLTMALAVFIFNKKYIVALLFVLLQILYFSIGGHKTVLIMTIIAIGLVFCGEIFGAVIRDFLILIAMLSELFLEIVCVEFANTTFLLDNISRRVYFLPQILNSFYYNYTTKNGFDYFAHGIGRLFDISSSYNSPLSQIISKAYFGTNGNSNNGMFSEAYSNLGFWGCIILPIVLLLIINFMGYFLKGKPYTIVTLFAFMCAYIWGSGNISTGLLTNGLLFCAISLFIVHFEGEKRYGKACCARKNTTYM